MINLDNNRLSYLEQTLDDIHIIDVEFDGIFEKLYYVSIDGQELFGFEEKYRDKYEKTRN